MVKKIFTKMILASTLFLGGVLGASIVNSVESNNNYVHDKIVNVRKTQETNDVKEELIAEYVFPVNTSTTQKVITLNGGVTGMFKTGDELITGFAPGSPVYAYNSGTSELAKNSLLNIYNNDPVKYKLTKIAFILNSSNPNHKLDLSIGSSYGEKYVPSESEQQQIVDQFGTYTHESWFSFSNGSNSQTINVGNASRVQAMYLFYTIEHLHTFDETTWAYDDTNHWHASTCEHEDEVSDLAQHEYDEGEVLSQYATKYTCSCGYSYTGYTYEKKSDKVEIPRSDAGKSNYSKIFYDGDKKAAELLIGYIEGAWSNGISLGKTTVTLTPENGYEIDEIVVESEYKQMLGIVSGNKCTNVITNPSIKAESTDTGGYKCSIKPIDKSKPVVITTSANPKTYLQYITVYFHVPSYELYPGEESHCDKCIVCGNEKTAEDHTWDEHTYTTIPTHEAAGKVTYTCKCGKTKTEITNPNVADEFANIQLVNPLTYSGLDQTQELEVTYRGVKLTENTHYTVSGNVAKDAGSYTLTVEGTGSLFEGSKTVEYTIAKAPLTITADSKEVTYGDVVPTYTVSYNGLVNNETKDVLSGELALSCAYDQYADAGNYPIVASGLTSNNYEITYVDGNLKVNPKEIGLEWSTNLEFIYDGEAHKPTATVTGLVNNDTCTVTVAGEKVNVGTHTATAEVLSNSNYKLPTEGLEKNYIINPKSISGAIITLGESLTYTGNELTQEVESVVLDGVTLVEGTDYEVSANKQTNAGTEYELIINGIGNYTGTLTKAFVVAKQKVDLPLANSNLVYTGTEITGVASSSLYNVTSGTAVNAGSYTATVTLKDSSNYEWEEEFDGTVEYSISKAQLTIITESKDVIYGDEVPTYTVSYNGLVNNETSAVLGGTLSFACTYSQTSNVGEYDIASSGLTSDNYDITYVNGKVTVSQKEVVLTWGETQFTYNGGSQLPTVTLTGLVNNDTCTVTVTGEKINAGTYEATVTALSNGNYKLPDDVTTEYVINKATYNMSGVSFTGKTVVENKQNQALKINGTLPSGLTVSYSLTECVEPGIYEIIASFTGDAANYNIISPMKATLVIKQLELKNESKLEEGRENDVIVSAPEGIDPTKELYVELVELEETDKDLSVFLEKGERVAIAYDVKLLKDGAEVQPDGTLKIKILIPEQLKNKNFSIMHIHNDTEKSILEYQIEGDYVVVETDKLSEFAFVYETGSILWLVIVLGVLALLEGGLLVYLILKDKQYKVSKLSAAYPPFIFGMFIPAWQIVMVIILIILVAALAVIDVLYAIKLLKARETTADEVEESNEPVVEETETDDEEVIKLWDEQSHSYTIVRLTKGFEARLKQSNDEIKGYYDSVKNELLSYKKVKSKISFKHEAFKFGKDCIARLKFRGKTLCLYLSLDPKVYENTKYKVEDMSEISSSSDVPTMYRINLPRREIYAKKLIKDLMEKVGVEKSENEYVEYSKNYPYEDNEVLLRKGLIKQSTKVVAKEPQQ